MSKAKIFKSMYDGAKQGWALGRRLTTRARSLTDARGQMQSMANHVNRVSCALWELGQALEAHRTHCSSDMIGSIFGIMDSIRETFRHIETALKKRDRPYAPIRWFFGKKDAQSLESDLTAQKTELQFHLSVLLTSGVGYIAKT